MEFSFACFKIGPKGAALVAICVKQGFSCKLFGHACRLMLLQISAIWYGTHIGEKTFSFDKLYTVEIGVLVCLL